MVQLARSVEEILAEARRADDKVWEQGGERTKDRTFEEGVNATLKWLTGEAEDAPLAKTP